MADPSYDLQDAIVDALKASAPVIALVADRIYDTPPKNKVFPYISYGSDQVLDDSVDCITAYEVAIQIDVWSRTVGQPEVKRIAGAVRAALHDVDLTLNEHALVLIEHKTTRYLQDPDGLTHHAAIGFRALADAT